jgi:predicted RNase H-like nuclease (RuvC/YqgF family)
MKMLDSYDKIEEKLENKGSTPAQEEEAEEVVPEYMRIKEIFSFENIARMHREIEQLKDVVREMRGYTIPKLEKENSELKEQNKQLFKGLEKL